MTEPDFESAWIDVKTRMRFKDASNVVTVAVPTGSGVIVEEDEPDEDQSATAEGQGSLILQSLVRKRAVNPRLSWHLKSLPKLVHGVGCGRSDRAVQDGREDGIAPRHWLASDPPTVPKAYQIPANIPVSPNPI